MNWSRPLKVKKKKVASGIVGQKLDWKVLSDGKCPACLADIELNKAKNLILCARKGCNFAISHNKFKEITSQHASSDGIRKVFSRNLSEEEQNLSELNNL